MKFDRELLRDIRTALKQIKEGRVLSNRAAKATLRKRFLSQQATVSAKSTKP
jgi:hypothetical protein